MFQRINLFSICRSGLKITLSQPTLWIFGLVLAVPEIFLQVILSAHDPALLETKILSGSASELIRFLLVLGVSGVMTLFLGAVGVSGIILLANSFAKEAKLPWELLWRRIYDAVFRIVWLELSLLVAVLVFGTLAMFPSVFANMRGLSGSSHTLEVFAEGFFLFIGMLALFLRQFGVLYLALSKISVRMALENGHRTFRRHIRESFVLGALSLLLRLVLILLMGLFPLISSYNPVLSSYFPILDWLMSLLVLAFYSVWLWTTWTLFFREIALPKEEAPVRQAEKSVVQKEAVPSLDNAS